jgi:hypothetical protein
MRLDASQLEVESFPTATDATEVSNWTGSTEACCDSDLDCSGGCDQPTNICAVCG